MITYPITYPIGNPNRLPNRVRGNPPTRPDPTRREPLVETSSSFLLKSPREHESKR